MRTREKSRKETIDRFHSERTTRGIVSGECQEQLAPTLIDILRRRTSTKTLLATPYPSEHTMLRSEREG